MNHAYRLVWSHLFNSWVAVTETARGRGKGSGWSWLRLQPGSQLSHWFNERFAGTGKRLRRIGIVALARRLAIALWRYLEHGEIPAGAILKSGDVNNVRA